MPEFSETSRSKLATCDERIQLICNEVIKNFDFSVLCGHRDKESQNEAYKAGNSQLRWPDSKHNKLPSLAVDLAPYPTDWKNIAQFGGLWGQIMQAAYSNGLDVIWGGNWKQLKDYGHFELKVNG
jgi:peptidoglycan L-alanyl-D-glutamate endopeptidase CwlK